MSVEVEDYFLNPVELIFSKKPVMIKTVLGSCVAVSIYDKANHFGGMCHYLLPESGNNVASTKYGDVAVPTLINKFVMSGSHKKDLEAHVDGGAFIVFDEREIFFIGDRNIEMAQNILRYYSIPVRSSNTGGEQGKKVHFYTGTGKIMSQLITVVKIDDLYNPKS